MVVTIWNEFLHERQEQCVKELYPEGIHRFIGSFLSQDPELEIQYATLDMPEHGLTQEVLERTDVLVWWGHMGHDQVQDQVVERVAQRVLRGMGLVCLHSAHHSKIFRRLMGTSGNLVWGDEVYERIFTLMPSHPIAQGVPGILELGVEEMYGERFDIPQPDELIFGCWFESGYLFRGGCVWNRGLGKVFYFQPGHETRRSFYHPAVQRVIQNGVHYVAPRMILPQLECPCVPRLSIPQENGK